MVPHGGVCATLLWRLRDFGLTARDTVLQNIPLTFDPSVWQIFGALLAGARLAVVPPGRHQDALWLSRTMRDEGVSVADFPPSLLRVLLEAGALAGCAALRCLFVGGEAFPPELRDRGNAQLAARLYNIYGPTEACIDIACWDCRREAGGLRVPIGRPIAGKLVFLLDAARQPVPVGVPGELHAGGDGLARGYAGRPDLTAAAFVPSPFAAAPGERLYRTGDRVRFRPDGALEFLGRADRQVKVRGRRIELGEIEALLGRHPQVREAAVTVRDDGAAGPRLVAYCVVAVEAPTPEALAAFLRRSLPEPLVPSAFVTLAALPATPNGKLDLAALPAPPAAAGAGPAAPAPPRTGLERTIAEVWGAVLQIEQPGIDDDFFALGGHSLLLARAQVRLAAALGRAVPIVDLFAHPTIRSLARHLAGGGEEDGFAAEEERARLQLAARRRQRDRLRAREPEVVS
jgi:acyl-coenzyme A synthetase/AMP-(fatty) acid ligase